MSNVKKQPKTYSDVVAEKIQSVDATVAVADGDELAIGTPLTSTDGGKTFTKAVDGDGVVVNGILIEILDAPGIANVLITGKVKVPEELANDITDRMAKSAFENKIILL